MKMFALAGFLAVAVTAAVPAQVKTVPAPLISWYNDAMGMYAALLKDLDQAQSAPPVAAAFDKATATTKAKNLAARYAQMKKQYPDFFNGADSGSTWVPPADWIKISQDWGRTLQNYGQSMQKAMVYANDPAVMKSLEDFSQAMDEIGED